MTPAAIAEKIRKAGIDHGSAVRAMVNVIAIREGFPPPWQAQALELPPLESIYEVGEVYQALLGRQDGKRGQQGSYFTPEDVADFITRVSIEVPLLQGKHPLDVLAMDPACGAGVFLVSAARKLARAWLAIEIGITEPSEWQLRSAVALVATECVFGVDIDSVAVDMAKSWLWLVAGGIPPITWMDDNIICGDTLEGDEPPNLRKRQGIVSGDIPELALVYEGGAPDA